MLLRSKSISEKQPTKLPLLKLIPLYVKLEEHKVSPQNCFNRMTPAHETLTTSVVNIFQHPAC